MKAGLIQSLVHLVQVNVHTEGEVETDILYSSASWCGNSRTMVYKYFRPFEVKLINFLFEIELVNFLFGVEFVSQFCYFFQKYPLSTCGMMLPYRQTATSIWGSREGLPPLKIPPLFLDQ